ncbi:MAG: hypothetical protein JOY85_11255 [Acidobacteriaceae bacterium]|nr:hypothetical protein [Acidobacteriaceae bacterium]
MSAGAAAAGAAAAQAIKASGAVVRIAPEEFSRIANRLKEPLIVMAIGGVFTSHFRYLVSYKGLVFFTKSRTELILPTDAELMQADEIWIPG